MLKTHLTKTTLLLLCALMISIKSFAAGTDDFILQVKTDYSGTSANDEFTIRTTGAGYNYNVDCDVNNANGYEASGVMGDYTCDYAAMGLGAGTYSVGIEDNIGDLTGFPRIYFNNNGDQRKVIDIIQWGTGKWTSMAAAFRGADHMIVSATDIPDLSLVTNMNSMFRFAFIANPDTSMWDVSNVDTMHSMFRSAELANPNTSNWVTTNLQTTTNMFWNATVANPDISTWDVSNVTDMSQMFLNANLSNANYEAALESFAAQTLQSGVLFDAGTSIYCEESAQIAKLDISSTDSWTINDGGLCAPTSSADLLAASDTGTSDNDDITSETLPIFLIQCSAVANKITLYSDNPVANTDLGTFICNTSLRGSAGVANINVTTPMALGLHNITYTDENGLDVSEHSPINVVEIRAVPNQPAIIDLTDQSDNGASFTDDITSITKPDFTAHCSDAGNVLQVYTDNPVANTAIASFSCTADEDITLTTTSNLFVGDHSITYTEQDIAGTSVHSPLMLMTIDLSLNDFVIQVKTDNTGTSSDTQFTIPTVVGEVYNYNVDCDNDGINEATGLTDDYTCDYPSTGTYTIRIKDNTGFKVGYPRIRLANDLERHKVVSLDQWGTTLWTSMDQAFSNTSSMLVTATDVPDFSALTSLRVMFSGAIIANPDTSRWDISNVTNINGIFERCFVANPDVSNWNTSQVTDMGRVFNYAKLANPDVSDWDTSQVTIMSQMFSYSDVAQPDTSAWITTNVFTMESMFEVATLANPILTSWDTSSVVRMQRMFTGAVSFINDVSELETGSVENMSFMFYIYNGNPNVGGWDTSQVTNMKGMFLETTIANPDVSNWNTSQVTDMESMFEGAVAANPDTLLWDTSNVIKMRYMFKNATSATLETNGLDVQNIIHFDEMFSGAISANPDTSNWTFSDNIFTMYNMFLGVTLSTLNYDTFLINLINTSSLRTNILFHGGNSVYCSQAAQQAHADLINNFNWTITDGSACAGVNPNVAPSFSITCDIDATDVLQYGSGGNDKNIKSGKGNAFVSFENFITDMSVGPVDESLQTYTLTTTIISDPDLVLSTYAPNRAIGFSKYIGLDRTGYIEIDINDQSNGVATLEVTMRDTGGVGNGGVDVTTTQFNVFHFADLALDPNLPMDIIYKNTFDPCRAN